MSPGADATSRPEQMRHLARSRCDATPSRSDTSPGPVVSARAPREEAQDRRRGQEAETGREERHGRRMWRAVSSWPCALRVRRGRTLAGVRGRDAEARIAVLGRAFEYERE